MNDGPPTDGVTGPIALLPALLGELLLGDPMGAQKLVGGLAAAIAVGLAVHFAAREGLGAGLAVAALAALGGVLPAWSVGGLETGLATLEVTLAALLLLHARPGAKAALAVGALIAAMAWTRPELAALALVFLALVPERRGLALAVALVGVAALLAFRLWLFSDVLPLSAHAKPPDLELGARYVARSSVVAFGGVGLVALGLGIVREPRMRGLGLALAAHAFCVLLAGGDWMPGMRLFVPVIPLYALVGGAGLRSLAKRAPRVAVALALGCCVVPVAIAVDAHGVQGELAEARETNGRALAAELAAAGGPIALVDAGFLAFSSGAPIIDLGGVTDPEIARLPGGHLRKPLSEAALLARSPAAIVLHSRVEPDVDPSGRLVGLSGHPIEHQIARMETVRRRWRVASVRRFGSALFYVVMRPREVALP